MAKKKVFCFGEILLRMSPQLNQDWLNKNALQVYTGGAELNVAQALANWGMPVKYGTAMPDNYLSQEILSSLQQKNIDVSAVHFSGNRIGTYYLPQGAELKNAGVIYDRAYSSFAGLKPGMIDWNKVLQDCDWFHFSAINPAVSQSAADVCLEAVKACAAKNIKISIDLNYREKLWQYGIAPVNIMPELVQHCTIIMGNTWSAESLLGIPSLIKESKNKTQQELMVAAKESMQQLKKQYKKASTIAYTFRMENAYWALLQNEADIFVSKQYQLQKSIDKAGSGDCFMGGLIYGLSNQHPLQNIVDFSAAAAVGKLQEIGDATKQSVADVMKRVNN